MVDQISTITGVEDNPQQPSQQLLLSRNRIAAAAAAAVRGTPGASGSNSPTTGTTQDGTTAAGRQIIAATVEEVVGNRKERRTATVARSGLVPAETQPKTEAPKPTDKAGKSTAGKADEIVPARSKKTPRRRQQWRHRHRPRSHSLPQNRRTTPNMILHNRGRLGPTERAKASERAASRRQLLCRLFRPLCCHLHLRRLLPSLSVRTSATRSRRTLLLPVDQLVLRLPVRHRLLAVCRRPRHLLCHLLALSDIS